jgi:subtilisin family serine protease
MRIKVTTPLNTRIGGAHRTYQTGTVREPGEEIEVTGTVQGEEINGNNTWYRAGDEANSNFWSGGAEQMDGADSNFQQWMVDLNLPEIWGKYAGTGVGVAVVDTGIAPGITDLFYNASKYYVYGEEVEIKDGDGHGTVCASIIGARNISGNSIGVAPACNLYICKISETRFFDNNETGALRYAEAIDWCASKPEIQIISISWSTEIKLQQTKDTIQKAINNAVNNKKIIICSIGNATSYGDNSAFYPACFENVIGVGAAPLEDVVYPFINEHLDIVVNGADIDAYQKDSTVEKGTGSSQATAIIAGIVALMVQKMNFSYTFDDIKNTLTKLCEPKTSFPIPADGSTGTFNLPLLNPALLLDFFNNTI